MTLARRSVLGLFAAGAATTLAGCGGGGDVYYSDYPTRFVWVLNVNPAFTSVSVAVGPDVVITGLPFPALTARIEVLFGNYVLGLRDSLTGQVQNFSNFIVDDAAPSFYVFYNYGGTGARLGDTPSGIVNYFDSSESLIADLDDGNGNVQTSVLAFERAAPQISASPNCRLRLSRASDGVLVYDSGLRQRAGALVIFPADATTGLVSVAAVNYNNTDANAVAWANIL
jgi:hypothetical protein